MNWTKIKGGCQSGRKVVSHNSNSDLPLAIANLTLERSDANLIDPLPDIDNQYIKLMPDQKFDILSPEDYESELNEESIKMDANFDFKPIYHPTRKIAYDLGLEDNDWVYDDEFLQNEDFDDYNDDIEWEYWDNENRGFSKKTF